MKKRVSWALGLLSAGLLMWPGLGMAEEPAACIDGSEDGSMSPTRYWRSLSLDLKGQMPSLDSETLATLREQGDVPQDWVNELTSSPEFAQQVGRQHRMLLLNNIRTIGRQIKDSNYQIYQHNFGTRDEPNYVHYRRQYAEVSRGERNAYCNDVKHDKFDAQGRALPLEEVKDAEGKVIKRVDGWVEVTPYWDTNTKIKVCAFDATETEVSMQTGRTCYSSVAGRSQDCGCGPGLNWCYANFGGNNTLNTVLDAFAEDVQKRIRVVIEQKRPYTEIFTGDQAWVNGPLVHYWKHWAQGSSRNLSTLPRPFDANQLPDIEFSDMNWYPIQLGPEHSGVLTSVPYLVRYQTNRSRANRFYTVFMCSPFQAPEGGLPVSDVREALEPDLEKRNGCAYCHALVEPAAAYWGRWSEYGVAYLDKEDYPAFDANCASCASGQTECSDRCRSNYMVSSVDVREQEYYGWLKPYNFLKELHFSNVEEGPKSLVDKSILNNALLGCTVDNVARQFLGRTLDPDKERDVRQQWIQDFAASNYDYTALVREVVTSDIYKKVQ